MAKSLWAESTNANFLLTSQSDTLQWQNRFFEEPVGNDPRYNGPRPVVMAVGENFEEVGPGTDVDRSCHFRVPSLIAGNDVDRKPTHGPFSSSKTPEDRFLTRPFVLSDVENSGQYIKLSQQPHFYTYWLRHARRSTFFPVNAALAEPRRRKPHGAKQLIILLKKGRQGTLQFVCEWGRGDSK